jgi:hypothetical protein
VAGGGQRVAACATAILIFSIVAGLAAGRIVLPAAPWAAVPVCAVAAGIAVAAPPPRYLRLIGWVLVAATTIDRHHPRPRRSAEPPQCRRKVVTHGHARRTDRPRHAAHPPRVSRDSDLRLSADTAAALLNVSQRHALVALESLVIERFLVRLPDGRYSRRV